MNKLFQNELIHATIDNDYETLNSKIKPMSKKDLLALNLSIPYVLSFFVLISK